MTRSEKIQMQKDAIKKKIHENAGIAKAAELYGLGFDYRKLQRLVDEGFLTRVKSGYYALAGEEASEEEQILALFPDGVLCMETALFYYGYLKQRPLVWRIAVDKNTSKSRFQSEYPAVMPYYTEGEVLTLGVTEIDFSDGRMKIYEKERLICDCLKYEDKMNRKDLKAALRCYLEEPDKDIAKLLHFAKERRVLKKVQDRIGVWL